METSTLTGAETSVSSTPTETLVSVVTETSAITIWPTPPAGSTPTSGSSTESSVSSSSSIETIPPPPGVSSVSSETTGTTASISTGLSATMNTTTPTSTEPSAITIWPSPQPIAGSTSYSGSSTQASVSSTWMPTVTLAPDGSTITAAPYGQTVSPEPIQTLTVHSTTFVSIPASGGCSCSTAGSFTSP